MLTSQHARRAFSLVEAIVVLVLVGVLAVVIIPQLDQQEGVGDDGQAQASLDLTLDAQVALRQSGGSFMMASDAGVVPVELVRAVPDLTILPRGTVSDASTKVSAAVSTSGTVVGLAAMGGNSTCWMVRRDFAASAFSNAPLVVHAFAPDGSARACTGAVALTLGSVPGAGDHPSWGNPLDLN